MSGAMATAMAPLTDDQAALFEAAMPAVERMAARRARLLGGDADDLRQEGAIAAMNAARRVLPLWGRVGEKYAVRSAANAMTDAGRRAARRRAVPLEIEPAERDQDAPLDREGVESVRGAVRSLDRDAAVVVAMRFYGGLSDRRIAVRMGWSRMRVRRVLAKALDQLRIDPRILEIHGGDE